MNYPQSESMKHLFYPIAWSVLKNIRTAALRYGLYEELRCDYFSRNRLIRSLLYDNHTKPKVCRLS